MSIRRRETFSRLPAWRQGASQRPGRTQCAHTALRPPAFGHDEAHSALPSQSGHNALRLPARTHGARHSLRPSHSRQKAARLPCGHLGRGPRGIIFNLQKKRRRAHTRLATEKNSDFGSGGSRQKHGRVAHERGDARREVGRRRLVDRRRRSVREPQQRVDERPNQVH